MKYTCTLKLNLWVHMKVLKKSDLHTKNKAMSEGYIYLFFIASMWIFLNICTRRVFPPLEYIFFSPLFLLLSSFHPLAFLLLFPVSPWHSDLQSDFILSPHQSRGREGSSLFCIPVIFSPSFAFLCLSSPPHFGITSSFYGFNVVESTSKEVFTLFSHPPIIPFIVFSVCLSTDGVISIWIIWIARSFFLSFFFLKSSFLTFWPHLKGKKSSLFFIYF